MRPSNATPAQVPAILGVSQTQGPRVVDPPEAHPHSTGPLPRKTVANKHPTLCLAKRHPLHPTWNSLPWFCHLEEPGSGKDYALRTSLPGMTSDGGRGKAGTLPGPPRPLARRCSFPRVCEPLFLRRCAAPV